MYDAPINPSSTYIDDTESERVVAVLDVNALAAVAADAVVGGGSSGVAAVNGDWLAALGASDGDEI